MHPCDRPTAHPDLDLDPNPNPNIVIKDSKQLSLKKRLLAYDYILDNSISYSCLKIGSIKVS